MNYLPSQERFLVYALVDPTNMAVKYVGRSSSSLKRARGQHSSKCKEWILSLKEKNLKPYTVVLETVKGSLNINDDLNTKEKFWISFFRKKHFNLVNMTSGGQGRLGLKQSPETKKKISNTRKQRKIIPWNKGLTGVQTAWNKGKIGIYSKESLEKMRKAKFGNKYASGKGKK